MKLGEVSELVVERTQETIFQDGARQFKRGTRFLLCSSNFLRILGHHTRTRKKSSRKYKKSFVRRQSSLQSQTAPRTKSTRASRSCSARAPAILQRLQDEQERRDFDPSDDQFFDSKEHRKR